MVDEFVWENLVQYESNYFIANMQSKTYGSKNLKYSLKLQQFSVMSRVFLNILEVSWKTYNS